MGIKLKISAKNIDAVTSQIKSSMIQQLQKIDEIIDSNVQKMANDAKASLPGKYSALAASISSRKVSDLKYELIADKDYAAYVEFGTGQFAAEYVATLEPEWAEIAYKFYKNGQGKLEGEPYFYPAINKIWPQMIKEIQNATNARYK